MNQKEKNGSVSAQKQGPVWSFKVQVFISPPGKETLEIQPRKHWKVKEILN